MKNDKDSERVISEKKFLIKSLIYGALFGVTIALIVHGFDVYIPEDDFVDFVLIVLLFPALIVEFIILPARQDLPQIVKIIISSLTLMLSYSFFFFAVANIYSILRTFRKNA